MSKRGHIGAVSISDLEGTSTVQNAGIGEAFSFERACGRAIEQMRAICASLSLPTDENVAVTYVFCDDLQAMAVAEKFGRINYVFMADRTVSFASIKNRIVLLSRSGSAGALSLDQYASFSDQASAIFDWDLQSAAAVTFQLNACVLTAFPLGMDGNQADERGFGTIASLFAGDELNNALEHFDKKWANAPAGHKKLWAKFKEETHVPCADTEKVIQEHLQLYLTGVDRSMVVVEEIHNASGRADLHLYSPLANAGSAVLELKVLRYCSNPKPDATKISKIAHSTNRKSAEEVVKQAAEYKEELKTERALARLYDMRKDPLKPEVTDGAHEIAAELGVELVVSRIHFSSQGKRNAEVAKKLSKKSSEKKKAA